MPSNLKDLEEFDQLTQICIHLAERLVNLKMSQSALKAAERERRK
jgi:hypothetical protein